MVGWKLRVRITGYLYQSECSIICDKRVTGASDVLIYRGNGPEHPCTIYSCEFLNYLIVCLVDWCIQSKNLCVAKAVELMERDDSIIDACVSAGGFLEDTGRCVCSPGFRSTWDAYITLYFCTEVDIIGVPMNGDADGTNTLSFWNQVMSCESPLLTIAVIVLGFIGLTLICVCLASAAYLYSRNSRQFKT